MRRIPIRSSCRKLFLKIAWAMFQTCFETSNISALLHSLWCFLNTFWCHNCPRRISAECGMLLVHIHITESYWYDCSPIVFIAKIFSNENGKCVVLDLRLFLGTRWYYTRKVQLTVCYQHDRALASDIPLWPLQPPCLLTIRRTEFLLSMHKDKCMSYSWMYQLYNDRGWDTLFLLDLYVWGKPSACTLT